MNYSVEFYNENVQADIMSLPETLAARFLSFADHMRTVGANLGEPHTKALSDGLFKLRLESSEDIARVFYCTLANHRIVMLHSFVKKTKKIPTRELKIAQNRLQEI